MVTQRISDHLRTARERAPHAGDLTHRHAGLDTNLPASRLPRVLRFLRRSCRPEIDDGAQIAHRNLVPPTPGLLRSSCKINTSESEAWKAIHYQERIHCCSMFVHYRLRVCACFYLRKISSHEPRRSINLYNHLPRLPTQCPYKSIIVQRICFLFRCSSADTAE